MACPCALGLATPTAIVVAVGRAAEAGLLVRDAATFEGLARVTHVALDKTGTLTAGVPRVTGVVTSSATSADEVVSLAAALESASEHPLARGILEEAARRGLRLAPATDVVVSPGGGIEGRVGGASIAVGAPAWLAARQVAASLLASNPDIAREASAAAATPVCVARDGVLVGGLLLSDPPRPARPRRCARCARPASCPCSSRGTTRRRRARSRPRSGSTR